MADKLININKNIYYIADATNIGVITEKQAEITNIYLIDGGFSPDSGKMILKVLDSTFPDINGKKSYSIKAIILTHSHADHACSCKYLEEQTGCEIWITQKERGNLEEPRYEQSIVWGGFPVPELQTPFYQIQGVNDAKIIKENDTLTLNDGTEITFLPLPGHHFSMIGVLVKTTENKKILFAADGIFGKNRMSKYWIPFLMDVGSFKTSLRTIAQLKADYALPSHGDLIQGIEIEATAELNRYAILTTEKTICKILETPNTTEDLLKAVADINHIPLRFGQYVLIGCTIRSYLSYLYRCGKIFYSIKDNRMYWQSFISKNAN